MIIKMIAKDGTQYQWTVTGQHQYAQLRNGHKPRNFHGWQFTDHENYTRVVEGTWQNLVCEFRVVSANYDLYSNIS